MVVIQDLLERIRKLGILLLCPLWAPLGVLSGIFCVIVIPMLIFLLAYKNIVL